MPPRTKSKRVKPNVRVRRSEHMQAVYTDSGIYTQTTLTGMSTAYTWTAGDRDLVRESGVILVDDSTHATDYLEPAVDRLITEAENEAHRVLEHPTSSEDQREEARNVLGVGSSLRSSVQARENMRETALRDLAEVDSMLSCSTAAESFETLNDIRRTVDDFTRYCSLLGSDAWSLINIACQFGRFVERMHVREFEPLALVGKEAAALWRGRAIRVTKLERRILETVIVADEVSLHKLVKHVWGEMYKSERREKYDQAFKRLNHKIADAELKIQLHVRGDKLIVE